MMAAVEAGTPLSGRPRGRPRDPRADAAILDAALELLAVHGYDRMTLAHVARTAGVSTATVYRRYPDKADLVIAAMEALREETRPRPTGDTRRDLVAQLEQVRRGLTERVGMALVGTVLVREREHPELARRFHERVARTRHAALVETLRRGQDSGEVHADADLPAAAEALIGAFLARYLSGEPFDPGWAARAVQVVWRGLGRERPADAD
jgi:AcrR family transcriptional regulator